MIGLIYYSPSDGVNKEMVRMNKNTSSTGIYQVMDALASNHCVVFRCTTARKMRCVYINSWPLKYHFKRQVQTLPPHQLKSLFRMSSSPKLHRQKACSYQLLADEENQRIHNIPLYVCLYLHVCM